MNAYMKFRNTMQWAPDGGAGAGTPESPSSTQNTLDNPPGEGDPTTEKPSDTPEKTFTQADVDAIINKKFAKWQQEKETAVTEAKAEAERTAKMTAQQKADYERQQIEETLAKREAEISRRELRAQALEKLAAKGLTAGLADVLDYTSVEACDASVSMLESAFRDAVQAGVEQRLKGTPPGLVSGGTAKHPGAEGGDIGLNLAKQLGKQASGENVTKSVLAHYLNTGGKTE